MSFPSIISSFLTEYPSSLNQFPSPALAVLRLQWYAYKMESSRPTLYGIKTDDTSNHDVQSILHQRAEHIRD